MTERMPCHITDGPQTPEDQAEAWDAWFGEEDEDAAYERYRQQEIDDAASTAARENDEQTERKTE